LAGVIQEKVISYEYSTCLWHIIRKAAVVGKRTAAIYAEAGRNRLFKYIKVVRGRSESKYCGGSLTSAILPNMNVLGKFIGTLESENREVGPDVSACLAHVIVTFGCALQDHVKASYVTVR